jgi:hypothetical protein
MVLAGRSLLLTLLLLLDAAVVTCSTRYELSHKGDDIGQPVSSRHSGREAAGAQPRLFSSRFRFDERL